MEDGIIFLVWHVSGWLLKEINLSCEGVKVKQSDKLVIFFFLNECHLQQTMLYQTDGM